MQHFCAVSCPEGQLCCGMPYLDGGDLDAARANARRNVDALLPLVKAGADVVVTQPTCSYVLKKEYPLLVPGEQGVHSVELANVMVYSSLTDQTVELPMDGAEWERELNRLIATIPLPKLSTPVGNGAQSGVRMHGARTNQEWRPS